MLEFFGGACLALDLFTRFIAALFAIEFAVITFRVSLYLRRRTAVSSIPRWCSP